MTRIGRDVEMRRLQIIDQIHVPPGKNRMGWSDKRTSKKLPSSRTTTGWRGWDSIIIWEVFKQLTKFTYFLNTDEEKDDQRNGIQIIDQVHEQADDEWRGWDRMIRKAVFKHVNFTYFLKTDEEDGLWWSDKWYSNNWPKSRTGWKREEDAIEWSDKG